jgi:hypothetical protein
MRVRPFVLAVPAVLLAACASPTNPTPNAPPPPATTTMTGTVTATNGGTPLAGVAVDVAGVTTTTDGSGRYTATVPASAALRPWRVTGLHVLTRSGYLVSSATAADFDAVRTDDGQFDVGFYQQFARDGFQPIQRWTQAPRFYLRTVDQAGRAVDARLLDATQQAIASTVSVWTAGRFGVDAIERGEGTRQGAFGWTTITWDPDTSDPSCGESPVGDMTGKTMNFYYRTANCQCAGTPFNLNIVRHELGHMLGYYHVSDAQDLMFPRQSCPEKAPSARERYHAAIVYSRPNGNTDPDADPQP